MHKSTEERFWKKVDIKSPEECWNYKGGKNRGYGQFYGGKSNIAHRYAFEISRGFIPDDKMILHKCDNPACCNPNHLYIGDQGDNMRDKSRRGRNIIRNPRKYNFNLARLSAEDVIRIRNLKGKGLTQKIIARKFGVVQATISNIFIRDKFPCKEGYYV